MDSLRLKNYRCFDDTGKVNLKPLTFLLGKNSSGKSSFLKFFPLLKQSVGIKRNGVFLWLSNDVDFKDFKNTVKNGEGDIEIEFEINDFEAGTSYNQKTTLEVSFVISSKGNNLDVLKSMTFKFAGQTIYIWSENDNYLNMTKAKIQVNNLEFTTTKEDTYLYNTTGLLPRLFFASQTDDEVSVYSSLWCEKQLDDQLGGRAKLGIRSYEKIYRTVFLGNVNDTTSFLQKHLKKLNIEDVDWKYINDLYLYYHTNNIIDAVNENLVKLSSRTSYIRPLRATAERYYRFQNYAVDEIDSDGKNLGMYLYNLSKGDFEKFQKWTDDIFRFKLSLKPSEGHVEMLIEEENKPPRNMVDIGFGYTQILPTIAIIWKSLYMDFPSIHRKYRVDKNEHLVVIEQPELHLHPAMQGKFAKMLAKIIMDSSIHYRDLRIIIETHSETILNKIGEMIEIGELDKEKVNVVLFNASEEEGKYIKSASFTKDGYLTDWPLGFLSDNVY